MRGAMVEPQLPILDPIHQVLAPKLSAAAFPDLNPKVITKREATYTGTKSAHTVKPSFLPESPLSFQAAVPYPL